MFAWAHYIPTSNTRTIHRLPPKRSGSRVQNIWIPESMALEEGILVPPYPKIEWAASPSAGTGVFRAAGADSRLNKKIIFWKLEEGRVTWIGRGSQSGERGRKSRLKTTWTNISQLDKFLVLQILKFHLTPSCWDWTCRFSVPWFPNCLWHM